MTEELREDDFEALLDAAQRGDGRGFDGLVRLVDRGILGFVRARGVDDPEGTTNDVLVKMCASIESFSGSQAQFRSWVFTIARHRVIDEYRRAGRRVQAQPVAPSELPHNAEAVLPSSLEQREWIDETLTRLTDPQREVILLRVVAGLSVEETASVMGRRSGAVRALQSRAIQELRSQVPDGSVTP